MNIFLSFVPILKRDIFFQVGDGNCRSVINIIGCLDSGLQIAGTHLCGVVKITVLKMVVISQKRCRNCQNTAKVVVMAPPMKADEVGWEPVDEMSTAMGLEDFTLVEGEGQKVIT